MSSHFTFSRILFLLALVCGPWLSAPAPASAGLQGNHADSAANLASLPPELQDVIAATTGAIPLDKFSVSGAPDDSFGQSVALSADGNTAIIGAPGTDLQDNKDIGVAYVFVRVGQTWQHQATLANYGLPAQAAGEGIASTDGGSTQSFGFSVSLSDDGNTALIGAPNSGGYIDQGAAFVFTRSGETWTNLATLTADDGAIEDNFGRAVALSGDGLSALIGAPGADIGANEDQGTAYLFTFTASTWTQTEKFFVASGAAGERLGSSVSLDDNGLTALVGAPNTTVGTNDNQGAAYIFAKPEDTWVATRLTADDGAADDGFGGAVAVSGKGSRVIVGAFESLIGFSGNAVYVYSRQSGVNWGDEQKLTAAESGRFGRSVAINDEGTTILIGATWDKVNDNIRQGAAYIFKSSGSTWGQQDRLLADDGAAEDWLGLSAALSDDGLVAFVGTVGIDIGSNENQGAVYAFTPTNADWGQVQKLTGASSPIAFFGRSVALSADGNTALIGAPYTDLDGVLDLGAAYIFSRSGGVWQFQARLVASDGDAQDSLGQAVALSADGNTAIVSAYWTEVGLTHPGAAYIFTHTSTAWAETQKLTVPGAADDWFGTAVALSGDGNTALIGATGVNGSGEADQGYAYVATRSGATWAIQPDPLVASDASAGAYFGRSLALNQDGSTALVGAIGDHARQGAAYIFIHSGSTWTEQKKLTITTGAANDLFGQSVALSDDGNLALVGAPGEESGMGRAYAFARSGSTWEQQRQFTISGGLAGDNVGYSVALSGDGRIALIGAWGAEVSGRPDQGHAYLFVRNGSTWSPRDILAAADGAAYDMFGWAVAISGDGSTALAGAQSVNVDDISQQGAAYPYALDYPESYVVSLPLIVR